MPYTREREIHGIRVVATLEGDDPPFWVEASVHEEDTWLCLGDYHEVRAPAEGFSDLVARMEAFEPKRPGSVVVQGDYPLRLLAIVHDVDREPSWRREWVDEALTAALRETERRGLRSIALAPLGNRHGRLGIDDFIAILGTALGRLQAKRLECIWLPMPDRDGCEALLRGR